MDAPWPHWRKAKRVYLASLVGLAAIGPVLAVDYCVMIPSAFIYLTAWGPINGLADEQPTCRVCGAVVSSEITR